MSNHDDYPGPATWGVELRFPVDSIPPEELQYMLETFVEHSGGMVTRRFAHVEMPASVPDFTNTEHWFAPEVQDRLEISIDDLFIIGDKPATGNLRRIANRLKLAGMTSARDILIGGKDYLTESKRLSLGEKSIPIIEGLLRDQCPEIPFEKYLLPHQIAHFCEDLDQVPTFGVRSIEFTRGNWRLRPLDFEFVNPRETIADILAAREAKRMTLSQKAVAQTDLDWFVQCFKSREPIFPPPSTYTFPTFE
jgi:hypothetical protein